MGLKLILFGRQGAGKGTQCEVLRAHYGAVHISTGDMLRDAVEERSELGLEAGEYLTSGELVPDELILGIVEERIAKPDAATGGFILDGFPRTVPQAEALWAHAGPGGIHVAIDLDVPLEVVKERLLGRGRDDDTENAIVRRLELYEEETIPTIQWFEDEGKLITVDGVGSPEEVSQRLIKAIDAAVGW
jgi:adenylate kinase